MTFEQWIYGNIENKPKNDGQWGLLHIITLIICIGLIVGISLLFRKKSDKTKRIILFVIAGILLFFELTRRVVNITNPLTFEKYNLLWVLLPRPGCAISVWLILLSPVINKKWFYNFASMVSILCSTIFFAYPGAGFTKGVILFENFYSIVTHSLMLVGAYLIVTLKIAKFNYKNIKWEAVSLGTLIIYSLLEMFVLKKNANGDPLEYDPFYIMPNNEVQEVIGINNYVLFFIMYVLFISLYLSAFYFFGREKKRKLTNKESN